jgi:death-on-curing protein
VKTGPLFLTLEDVIEIHDYQIEHFGGIDGLRSAELLKSAIGMPSSSFSGKYLHPTIPEMAAAYLFHLVENHPFLDGNKRVGAMAALVFLELNEFDFDATDEEYTKLVVETASGILLKPEVALFFQQHSHSRV